MRTLLWLVIVRVLVVVILLCLVVPLVLVLPALVPVGPLGLLLVPLDVVPVAALLDVLLHLLVVTAWQPLVVVPGNPLPRHGCVSKTG